MKNIIINIIDIVTSNDTKTTDMVAGSVRCVSKLKLINGILKYLPELSDVIPNTEGANSLGLF